MHVIVAGGGVVGQRVAQALEGGGNDVVIIEADAQRCTGLAARGLRVIAGNACAPHRLEQAGALHADVLVACTGADEDNLIISVMARRQFDIPRIVATIRDDANRWLFDSSWGVDAAISAASALVTLIDQATGALIQAPASQPPGIPGTGGEDVTSGPLPGSRLLGAILAMVRPPRYSVPASPRGGCLMSMPFPPNPPNLGPLPRPRPEHSRPEAAPCTRCGHRARFHPDSGSCSARGRWWRRCQCTGYTG